MTEDVVLRILTSKKYGGLCEDTIRRVAEEACRRYKKPREAERAAREALHGITGAFMSDYDLKRVREYMACGRMDDALLRHSSTRERMPIGVFYDRLFSNAGTPKSVLDIACGLNPYYLGYIGIKVTGFDINAELMDALNDWAEASGAPVEAYTHDVLCKPLPLGEYDLALMMKLLPVLENQRKGSAIELLRSVTAERIVVTFPTLTLGGKKIGMERHYAQWFEGLIDGEFTITHRYIINYELVYIIKRGM